MQRRHRRNRVRVLGAALEQCGEVEPRQLARDDPDRARRRLELAEAAREPRRRGREERVGGEAHQCEQRHRGDVAAEAVAREEPEPSREQVRREEVAHVHGPGGVVPPAQVEGPVPEVLLQPHRRRRPEPEEPVCLELRPDVRLEQEPVGLPAQQVVRPEDQREREPLEHDPSRPAADVRDREGEQPEEDPHEQPLARRGDAVAVDDDRKDRQIEERRCEPQQPDRLEVPARGFGRRRLPSAEATAWSPDRPGWRRGRTRSGPVLGCYCEIFSTISPVRRSSPSSVATSACATIPTSLPSSSATGRRRT